MTTKGAGAPLRGPEAPQRPTFLELFFDLAFVFTLSQLSGELVLHLNWSGAFQTLVLLLAMLRVWISTTWITDRLDPLSPAVQLVISVTLLAGLVLAVALPQAFGKYGLIFASVYVAVHVGRSIFLVLATRGLELRSIAWRTVFWSSLSAPLWIAGAFTHGIARGALWTLAIAVDYAGFELNFPVPGAGRVLHWQPSTAPEHVADRYQQFFIIALGELIVVSGETLSRGGVPPDRMAAFVVSTATAALLLRIYIYRAGKLLSAAFRAVPMSARFFRRVAYVHIAMVAAVVVTAVGAELVIAHPSGRTALARGLVILGGPALFLVGRAGFEYAVFARVSPDRPIGVLLLTALAPVALLVSPLLVAVAAMAVLAGIVLADAARARARPAEVPSPPGGPS